MNDPAGSVSLRYAPSSILLLPQWFVVVSHFRFGVLEDTTLLLQNAMCRTKDWAYTRYVIAGFGSSSLSPGTYAPTEKEIFL